MTERVCCFFDPICPWCYQTSRWARRLEELGVVELDWGVFSLELQNAGEEPEELAPTHARSALESVRQWERAREPVGSGRTS